MNHDATHCLDYTPDCPKTCYRAELEADLMEKWEKFIGIPISYSHFRGTEECKRGGEQMSLISRKEALWTFQDRVCHDIACFRCPMTDEDGTCRIDDWLKELPSAEIVRCKDCKKHNKEVCIDVPYKDDACPLISWRGKAQGHEFDYQYCPYGERKG